MRVFVRVYVNVYGMRMFVRASTNVDAFVRMFACMSVHRSRHECIASEEIDDMTHVGTTKYFIMSH